MSKPAKLFIGILTILPALYAIYFVFIWFVNFFGAINAKAPPQFAMFETIMIRHFIMMFLCLGLMIFYILHCVKNPNFKSDQQVMWVLVILMGSLPGWLIYFYMHIWKAKPGDPSK